MCAKSGGRSVNASDIVALRLGSLDDELEIVRACRNRLQDAHFHFCVSKRFNIRLLMIGEKGNL